MASESFALYPAVALLGFVAFLGAAAVYVMRKGEKQAVVEAQRPAQVSPLRPHFRQRHGHQAVLQTLILAGSSSGRSAS